MSKEEEVKLFKKVFSWLKPNGGFILDSPETVELKNSWMQTFPTGIVKGQSSFDQKSRIQDIQFYFKPNNEDEFGIYDPYDLGKGNISGVLRYLYPKEEIIQILTHIGFKTFEHDHYYENNYFSLLGRK